MIDEKKLIERLEEVGWVFADYYPDGTEIHKERRKSVPYDEVIKIVNQLAEEYNNESYKGKWINTAPSSRSDNIVCSECGYNSIADYPFCPNCGRRMKDGVEAKAYNETLDILLDFLVSLGIENVCEELGDNLWGMDNADETWCSRNCGVINDETCPSKECYLEYAKMLKAESEVQHGK